MTSIPPERLNIAEYFLERRIGEGLGSAPALHLDDRTLTYGQVNEAAVRFGQVLRGLGVRREERVLIALPDGADFVAAFFGALKIGAVVVMVNPQLQPDRLAALFDYTQAGFAILGVGSVGLFEQAADAADWRPGFLVVGLGEHGYATFEAEQEAYGGDLETAATHRDDSAIWLFSGGTTGTPKAVVQTHRSFVNTTELYAKAALGYRADDKTMAIPKLFFGYATGSNLLFPFAVGASAVLFPEHPTAEIVFDKIRRHRPTILINVPTMINKMVSHGEASQQDLSCLRFATSAGEALPVPLYEQWKERFGVELLDGLGTAEMWHVFISNLPGAVKPGTLGRPVPGFDVRVCDDEGREVPRGEIGRLWVRGGSRAICYWRKMEKTEEAFRGEWFVGGDLVAQDEEGYVTYCGRSDDVLKVSGKWLAPQEVESCLMRHDAVQECAVVGAETAEGLIKPVAFVLTAGSSDDLEDELKRFVLDRLEAYKHPRRVIVLDSFPRTHLGKIDRGKLKALAEEN